MRIHELLNNRADKRIWGMAPCEICDTPTRWCLSPYCLKCEWLVAYWRNGVVDLERALGDLPPPEPESVGGPRRVSSRPKVGVINRR